MPGSVRWPQLSYAAWRDTGATLHLWTQIVGKTRLALAPYENHWWHVALYATERGLTTMPMRCRPWVILVEFDFLEHRLGLRRDDGASRTIPLEPMSVARFHGEYLAALRALDCEPVMMARPVEVEVATPFAQDHAHAAYDPQAVHAWWRALSAADQVFKRFRSRFVGKQSPAHFFWGSFDHAVTRFSGRMAPPHPGGAPNCPDYVMVQAYSHECSSAGFWPGGGPVEEAAFYAYAYPQPPGYADHPVQPASAYYHPTAREFVLPYESVRSSADPEASLLAFLQSTYEAAATLGKWDRVGLERGS